MISHEFQGKKQAKQIYSQVIEKIFFSHYHEGMDEIEFDREEIAQMAADLDFPRPKNLGDVIYSFRYRKEFPPRIQKCAPKGKVWIIRSIGGSRYKMSAIAPPKIIPGKLMSVTKVPDATPGVISMYALNDEQALLARLRYNRLIDIFTGVTCYSLQSHLRTNVPKLGQIETDEIYVGIVRKGIHYVIPIQAKSKRDNLNIVQIEQDYELCAYKYNALVCKPIGAKFMDDDVIALFAFEQNENGIVISLEKHYKLVSPEEFTSEDLKAYQQQLHAE